MKIFIASDVHGSAFYLKKAIDRAKKEKADRIILLGDIYNHGPRNPFPKDYNPTEVAEILNGIKDKLIVVKGNCDSEVDKLISEFDFVEELCLIIGDKTVLCTHGHIYNKDCPPQTVYNAVIYGHFHTGFIEKKGDTIFANAGSVSLPKNDTPNSYIIVEGNVIMLKTLDGKEIDSVKL